jgi:hypothetical protein
MLLALQAISYLGMQNSGYLASFFNKSIQKICSKTNFVLTKNIICAYREIPREKPNPPRGGDGKPRVFKSAGDGRVAWEKATRFCAFMEDWLWKGLFFQ